MSVEVNERLERLRRRAELEQRLSSSPAPAHAGREVPTAVLLVDQDAPAVDPDAVDPVPTALPEAVTVPAERVDVVAPRGGDPGEVLRVLHDLLAVLQPVLRDHPGVTVGIWPAGTPADDAETALQVSLDPVAGLTVQVPTRVRGGAGADGGNTGVAPAPSVARQLAGLLRGEIAPRPDPSRGAPPDEQITS